MSMSRRGFLRRSLIVAAVAATPLAIAATPSRNLVLHGDGDHDDSDAFEAWLNGKRVYTPEGDIVHPDVLSNKSIRCTRTLEVDSRQVAVRRVTACTLDFSEVSYFDDGMLFHKAQTSSADKFHMTFTRCNLCSPIAGRPADWLYNHDLPAGVLVRFSA